MRYDRDNDVNRIFLEDSREKKRTAVGIHARASRLGFIRGGIKTPSDFLTAKEKRALNGEVKISNMYDEYKDIENVNITLDDLLTKSNAELKTIFTIIKENNSCTKVCKKLKLSNGKLYGLYEKYGAYVRKEKFLKPEKIQIKGLISKNEFQLMSIEKRGEYLIETMEQQNVSLKQLAPCLGMSIASVSRYARLAKLKQEEIEKEQQLTLDEVASDEGNMQYNYASNIVNDNSNNKELYNKIEDLEKQNKELIEQILNIAKDSTKRSKGLVIDVNGDYSKDELSNRLLSLDNITLNNKMYRIELHLEEIEETINNKIIEEAAITEQNK